MCIGRSTASTTQTFQFLVKKCWRHHRTNPKIKTRWAQTYKYKNRADETATSGELLSPQASKSFYKICSAFCFKELFFKLASNWLSRAIDFLREGKPKHKGMQLPWALLSRRIVLSRFRASIKQVAKYEGRNFNVWVSSQRCAQIFSRTVLRGFCCAHRKCCTHALLTILTVLLVK